ncbi:biliverdin-producing heme oxygenase [Burkholderia gladioli]|uniref:biliverdin-producing heme oxygenase n=1 Tax=Burkholderia gladioli TaxID=28095 RepID=UPI00163F769B|nr:biliverdin-producing heme oxygenase [Burkholderia gladioli]
MLDEIRPADAHEASPSTSMAGRAAAPATQATPPVLARLREATGEQHELLHGLMPLAAPSPTLSDYLSHLLVLRAWLAPLEPWLAARGDGLAAHAAAVPPVDRRALIDADLAAAPRDAVPAGPASLAPWWPADADRAYRWGASYVIEGSQMGGAVLYQQLHERLAPHPLDFLASGRNGLSARWKAFVRCLAAEVIGPDEIDAACRGAVDAFDRLVALARACREPGGAGGADRSAAAGRAG